MAADPFIRRVLPEDVEALTALCVEHAVFEGVKLDAPPDKAALHAALFGASPPLICWVVERGGDLLGYATATREFSTWQACYYLHMDCLYLKPDARNLGLGEQLAARLAGDAVGLQCKGMQWQTPADNLRAARFYRRIGAQSKDKLRFYLSASETSLLASQAASDQMAHGV